MKAYIATVRALNWLIVVAISIAAILWFAGAIPDDFLPPATTGQPENQQPEGDQARALTLKEVQIIAFTAGVIMLALNLLGITLRARGAARPHYLIFEKEGAGSLKVAVDAIEDTLTKCAADIPEVREAGIEMVLEKGGKMPRSAVAHCIFSDVPNLFAVQENVRQSLTNRYQEIFPNEELNFEIVVDRLRSEPRKHHRKRDDEDTQQGGEEAEGKPFGLKYPVGD